MSQETGIVSSAPNALETLYNAQMLHEFDLADFGVMPELDKSELNGLVIIVTGISEAEFEGDFAEPAKSILWLFPHDAPNTEPWGLMFAKSSPIIKQTATMVERGKVPFLAQLELTESRDNKGREYWTMRKVRPQYDENGILVDPNRVIFAAREAARKAKAK